MGRCPGGGPVRGRGRLRGALGEHPGVLGAAALAGVDDQVALLEGDPGQAAGQDPDVVAVVDGEGTQVDVAGRHAFAREGRGGGQGDGALGDETARVLADGLAGPLQGFAVGLRPDDDALAAGPVDGLHDEPVDLVEDGLQLAGFVGAEGLHIGKNRFL